MHIGLDLIRPVNLPVIAFASVGLDVASLFHFQGKT